MVSWACGHTGYSSCCTCFEAICAERKQLREIIAEYAESLSPDEKKRFAELVRSAELAADPGRWHNRRRKAEATA